MREDGGRLAAAAALCLLAVCLGCEKPPIKRMGISGGAISLEPQVNDIGTNLTEITWKTDKRLVAEWDKDLWVAPQFSGRVVLDLATGSLTLQKLQQNDSGNYIAEAVVVNTIQCTRYSLQILEPPKPPQLNCTAIGDRIQVSCELDAPYAAEEISPTYEWKYQKSNKHIPGSTSEISLEKDIDHSESITCTLHVLDVNTSSSISLKDCIPTGAASQRNRAYLLFSFGVVGLISGMAVYFRKRGCGRNRKMQECEEGTGAAGAPPEEQCLREERSENVEENSSRGPSDPVT